MENQHTLELRRIIRAPRERVFAAWTNAEVLTRWFAPSPDYTVIAHQVEARADGHYRIEMRHKNGASHVATGQYREVKAPERLVFTWKWEGAPMADTLVTIELRASGADTEIVLIHSRFATESERQRHGEGWTGCLAQLQTALSPEDSPTHHHETRKESIA
jgi:uncharacterized protein YndB with AHSA1/START domain